MSKPTVRYTLVDESGHDYLSVEHNSLNGVILTGNFQNDTFRVALERENALALAQVVAASAADLAP